MDKYNHFKKRTVLTLIFKMHNTIKKKLFSSYTHIEFQWFFIMQKDIKIFTFP